ncbi:MAG TPA: alpha/beta hydrolase [Gammaproteobacteria bacterium]|nr:alpha/beta hydrolase [Gammaproteobacteria bacterium]
MSAAGKVVFVHGAGGGPWEWEAWLPVFRASGWCCEAVDLQGDGRDLAALRFEDYLDRVRAAATGAGDHGPVALAGASLGGLMALAVAGEVSAAALCLVNPVSPEGTPGRPGSRGGQRLPAVVRWSREATRQGTRRSMPDADEAAVTRALGQWRDESGAVLERVRGGVACATPACPALLFYGTPDREVSRAAISALRERCRADLVVAEGAGHVGVLLGRRAALWAGIAETWLRATMSRGVSGG